MDEPTEQHDAQTRGSLYQIAVAIAHLWITSCWVRLQRLPTRSEYYIYDHKLEWGREALRGKRIRVTIEIEDCPR